MQVYIAQYSRRATCVVTMLSTKMSRIEIRPADLAEYEEKKASKPASADAPSPLQGDKKPSTAAAMKQ